MKRKREKSWKPEKRGKAKIRPENVFFESLGFL